MSKGSGLQSLILIGAASLVLAQPATLVHAGAFEDGKEFFQGGHYRWALEKFVEESIRTDSDLVCLSAMMTTTMINMPKIIELLRSKNPRVKVMVGGAPVSDDLAKRWGADGYAPVRGEAARAPFLGGGLPPALLAHHLGAARRTLEALAVAPLPTDAQGLVDTYRALGAACATVSNGSSILFGFAKDRALSKSDKEVTFATQLGRLLVKVKFEPKEMVYRGELAL